MKLEFKDVYLLAEVVTSPNESKLEEVRIDWKNQHQEFTVTTVLIGCETGQWRHGNSH